MEKYYLSKMKDANFSKCANEIYLLTDYNKKQYKDYYKWFYTTNIPRILSEKGEAIIYLDGFNIAGLIILKNSLEKKICTFMTNPEYRKLGISKELLEDAFGYLKTDRPLITIPTKRLQEFQSIIDTYKWKQSYETDEYMSPELVFNKEQKLIKSIDSYQKL